MRVKLDEYKVFCKTRKREYEIIVFPEERYMWAYDDFPEEDMLLVDGNKDAYKALKFAYAILAQCPKKIIYFPIRKVAGKKNAFWDSHDLVLLRPELQFRRSEWFSIKRKLDKKHLCGKFVFDYERVRLQNYYEQERRRWDFYKWYKKAEKLYGTEILGDTLFMVVPKLICLENHDVICDMLDSYKAGASSGELCYWVGWLLSDRQMKNVIKN